MYKGSISRGGFLVSPGPAKLIIVSAVKADRSTNLINRA